MRRAMVAAGIVAGTLAVSLPVERVAAQTLQVTNSTLPSGSVAAAATDFTANNNTGSSKVIGTVTFTVNCTAGTTCTVRISTPAAQTTPTGTSGQPTGRLTWTTTAGTGGSGIACTSGGSAVLTTTPTLVLTCTATGNNQVRTQGGNVITFSYPISWATTPPSATGAPYGTALNGIQLQVTSP